jgi:hypothetical protein
MLVVETYIGPSRIHGMGVFAARPLTAGTLVWAFDPAIDQEITADQLASLPEEVRRTLLSRSFVSETGRTILSRDNGVFLNHSETPNMSGDPEGSVAVRNIARGEELTEDYRLLPPGACRAFLDLGRPRATYSGWSLSKFMIEGLRNFALRRYDISIDGFLGRRRF